MDVKQFNRLLKGVRSDSTCFDRLYKFYYPKIVFYITRVYNYANFAEDVAQEFFQWILTSARMPAYVSGPTIWVMNCCDNIAEQFIEKGYIREREQTVDLEAAEEIAYVPDLGNAEASRELLQVLDKTTERIVVMKVCEGYGFKEIAELLDVGYAAVRKRYSRGIRRMRAAEKLLREEAD